jgi:GGDEF domain-containing protein
VADEAIREAGRAVSEAGGEPDAFVGHVGGDDFVLVCGADEGARLAGEVRARFSRAILRHLPDDAALTGTYRGRDRAGVAREFPITRLSAAVVQVDPARWPGLEAMGARVAEAKARAKMPESGGIVEIDL